MMLMTDSEWYFVLLLAVHTYLHHFLSQSLTLYSACTVTFVILNTIIVHVIYVLAVILEALL